MVPKYQITVGTVAYHTSTLGNVDTISMVRRTVSRRRVRSAIVRFCREHRERVTGSVISTVQLSALTKGTRCCWTSQWRAIKNRSCRKAV